MAGIASDIRLGVAVFSRAVTVLSWIAARLPGLGCQGAHWDPLRHESLAQHRRSGIVISGADSPKHRLIYV